MTSNRKDQWLTASSGRVFRLDSLYCSQYQANELVQRSDASAVKGLAERTVQVKILVCEFTSIGCSWYATL